MAEAALLAGLFVAIGIVTMITDVLPVRREALYLLAGILVGQFTVVPSMTVLAELGGALLVFIVAASIQTRAVMDVVTTASWAVSAQVCLLFAATLVALAAGLPVLDAVLLGMACSMSSSMLGIDLVENQVDRRLLHGRLTEAITMGQDIAAVLIIAALPFWPQSGMSLGVTVLACIGIILAIRAQGPMQRLLEWMGRDESTTLMVGLMVLWLMVAATGWHPYGVILGAVLAGFLMAGRPENITMLETIEPVRDFFAALFFVILGVLVGVPSMQALGMAAFLVIIIAIIRPLLMVFVLYQRGVDLHTGFLTALQLDQVSEIVLLASLLLSAGGLIGPALFQAIIIAAAASFILSELTTRHAQHMYPLFHTYLGRDRQALDRSGHTIIAGYGGWGRAAAAVVEDPVIVDSDPDKVARAQTDGYTAVLGDVHDHTTWQRVSVGTATVVIQTVPSDAVAEQLMDREDGFDLVAVTDTPAAAERVRERGAVYAQDDAGLGAAVFRTALAAAIDGLCDGDDGESG